MSVLGGGVDVPYPRENRWLYEDVAAAGALISEYPPGTEHRGEHFPVRNRILSGLCLGVVAVECRPHSGTMITVDRALEQNRDLFAVPGNIDAPMSQGPNLLIQQGAKLVTSGRDILEEYWDRFPGQAVSGRAPQPGGGRRRLETAACPAPAPAERERHRRHPGGSASRRGAAGPLYRRRAGADRRLGRTAPLRRRAGGGRTDPGPPGALCPDHAPGAGGGGRGAGPPLLRPGGAGGIDP